MEPADIEEVRKAAEDNFASGMFCAESVVLAIADAEGIESELLPKLATGFCSGMGRSRGTCGALSGAIMGIGLALGRSVPNESVAPAYEGTQRLVREFESEFGSRECDVLLGGCDLATAEGQTMFKEEKLGLRCLRFTGRAAEIAAQVIVESR